jgi:chemotaxis signal transduction protein
MSEKQNIYIEDLSELKDENSFQLVGFKLGDEEYAIDVLKIQEIIRLIEITTVPRTDPYILGVINLRGKVIPVVDLRVRFELDRSDFDKKTRIIVVKFEKENIGFVVDEVTEVIRIDKSIVEPTPPLVGAVGQEYILGICKYQKRLIILLDIDRVVYDDDSLASDLRKKIINAQDKQAGALERSAEEEDLENGGNETETKDVEELIVEEKQQDKFELTERDDSEAVDNEVTKLEDHADEIDDIDKLIAIELAKREQETEELLKKKKDVDKTEAAIDPVEDILNDALNQANSKISPEVSHVDQDDLDRLIAEELAKREKETEELLRRKKEEEKKR